MSSIYYIDISKIGRDFSGKKDVSILSNDSAVLESVMNILETEPGELVMEPTFGCSLRKFLFDPEDELTSLYITKEIEDAIALFEPRVTELQVLVEPDPENNTYIINVAFNTKITNQNSTVFQLALNKIR